MHASNWWIRPMGNIVNGVELIRKMLQESFSLTSPLITLASGLKMGETEKGNLVK